LSDSIKSTAPNILFFLADQHRYDWLGSNPSIPVRTPNLDQLVTQGTRFEQVFCPSPLCAPSRACLASGKEYHHAGVPSNTHNYPVDQTTYYQLLRDVGFHVAGCGKFDLSKAELDWGKDGKRLIDAWGFSDGINSEGKWDAIRSMYMITDEARGPYAAYLAEKGWANAHQEDFARRWEFGRYSHATPTPLPEEVYCDNWIARTGLSLMEDFPEEKPWHLVVNFAGPHEPLDVTEHMNTWYENVTFPEPDNCGDLSSDEHQHARQHYAAIIQNIDRWLGVYKDALKKSGQWERTLVVYSSDHGEMLGDHGLWMKNRPYQPSVGVPLIMAGPGLAKGQTSGALVSLMDLAATFLDEAGVPLPDDMDSRSLRPILEGRATRHRDYLLSGLDPWQLVYDGRYKLIQGYDIESKNQSMAAQATPVLFDLQEDPLETTNLATQRPEEVKRLARILEEART